MSEKDIRTFKAISPDTLEVVEFEIEVPEDFKTEKFLRRSTFAKEKVFWGLDKVLSYLKKIFIFPFLMIWKSLTRGVEEAVNASRIVRQNRIKRWYFFLIVGAIFGGIVTATGYFLVDPYREKWLFVFFPFVWGALLSVCLYSEFDSINWHADFEKNYINRINGGYATLLYVFVITGTFITSLTLLPFILGKSESETENQKLKAKQEIKQEAQKNKEEQKPFSVYKLDDGTLKLFVIESMYECLKIEKDYEKCRQYYIDRCKEKDAHCDKSPLSAEEFSSAETQQIIKKYEDLKEHSEQEKKEKIEESPEAVKNLAVINEEEKAVVAKARTDWLETKKLTEDAIKKNTEEANCCTLREKVEIIEGLMEVDKQCIKRLKELEAMEKCLEVSKVEDCPGVTALVVAYPSNEISIHKEAKETRRLSEQKTKELEKAKKLAEAKITALEAEKKKIEKRIKQVETEKQNKEALQTKVEELEKKKAELEKEKTELKEEKVGLEKKVKELAVEKEKAINYTPEQIEAFGGLLPGEEPGKALMRKILRGLTCPKGYSPKFYKVGDNFSFTCEIPLPPSESLTVPAKKDNSKDDDK